VPLYGQQREKSIGGSVVSGRLTQKEDEVLHFIALGLRNEEIAEILTLSEETIKSRVRRILQALDALNRTHAVSLAWEKGIVTTQSISLTRRLFLRSRRKNVGR